jgi:polyhydroxybutyrate depolymerase
MKRGKSSQMVMAGGAMRTFVYYAPQNLDPNKPAPVVIIPHGFTMSGEAMFTITGYDKIADREGFVAIYPDGEPGSLGPWNVGSGICGAGAFVGGTGDDQAFVDAMLTFTEADQCVDHDHVFMTGFSMGGYFSNETGCLRKEVRAIGPHSGGTHPLMSCPVGHKPVILFHFTTDALISYSCGTGARDEWTKHNGCTTDSPMTTMVKGGTCEYYKCPADGQVALCSFVTPSNHSSDLFPGHAWSGGAAGQSFSISETENAAELGWAFFKKYAW